MYEGFAVRAYKCPYCGKYYMRTGAFADHMYICDKNPENKMICYNCAYFIPPKPGYDPTYAQCEITEQKMAKRKRLVKDMRNKKNIDGVKQYPITCNQWKDKP